VTLVYHVSTVFSAGLFLFYGFACLFANGMVDEFKRFGLSQFRRLTGSLELLGAIGLLVGYVVPVFALVSALGLAALMALGVGTRVRARDSLIETAPAAVLMVMNAFIAWHAWRMLSSAP